MDGFLRYIWTAFYATDGHRQVVRRLRRTTASWRRYGERVATTRGSAQVPLPACPVCSEVMEAGVVVGRSPGVKFKPSRSVMGDLGGTLLTTGIFNHSVDALRCSGCGTVVIPGSS